MAFLECFLKLGYLWADCLEAPTSPPLNFSEDIPLFACTSLCRCLKIFFHLLLYIHLK